MTYSDIYRECVWWWSSGLLGVCVWWWSLRFNAHTLGINKQCQYYIAHLLKMGNARTYVYSSQKKNFSYTY